MAEDAFGVLLTGLVEAIHVELSDEAIDLVVPEELGKDDLFEFGDVFDDEILSRWTPEDGFGVFFVLS